MQHVVCTHLATCAHVVPKIDICRGTTSLVPVVQVGGAHAGVGRHSQYVSRVGKMFLVWSTLFACFLKVFLLQFHIFKK
jgi:hypothetical protein